MASKEEHLKLLRATYGKKLYLTPEDIAEIFDCSKQTIYNRISNGTFKIPYKKDLMGDLIRISIIDFAEYLSMQKI